MDRDRLLHDLQQKQELQPDLHDGSYEIMRETIAAYATLDDYSQVTYLDLNAIYLMAVISWKINVEKKKEKINQSCLPNEQKIRLSNLIDRIWDDTCRRKYGNIENPQKPSVGMFGTGFYSFEGKTTDDCAKAFVKMCVDISKMGTEDSDTIFNRVEEVLGNGFKGMKAASASVILHCLKPMVFPILNGNMGNDNIYIALGIPLDKPTEVETYISNSRKIREFRDANMPFKNYRILDLMARELDKYKKSVDGEQSLNIDMRDIHEEVEDVDMDKKIKFNNNIILYGPPGTGKTYSTTIYAVAIIEGKSYETVKKEADTEYKAVKARYDKYKSDGQIEFITFHQSYGYEEFIEGIRPVVISDTMVEQPKGEIQYEIKPGVFREFCERASCCLAEKNYVFIIDEINRGNISKIFGELITLIETTKRLGQGEEVKVRLPYSGIEFGVPSNIYIIGTMNTADKSIAQIDTALRRRFSFVEMMPKLEVLTSLGLEKINIDDKELKVINMLETINKRIEFLFDREHTIGHAYFTILDNNATLDKLSGIFSENIIPLLQEYFYDDYEKIRLVLGDNNKSKPLYEFVNKKEESASSIFNGTPELDETYRYRINIEAFKHIESFIEIYEGAGVM
jgi:hypothetical protein